MKVCLLGGGRLGSAIAEGIAADKTHSLMLQICDRHPDKLEVLKALWPERFSVTTQMQDAVTGAEVVVLLVKPKDITRVSREIANWLSKDVLVISCAAGVPVGKIEQALQGVAVARAMPNVAIKKRRGATAVVFGAHVQAKRDLLRIDAIFGKLGELFVLPSEDQFHAVSALLGSGPAFFMLFLEAVGAAGVKAGLAPLEADRFARAAFLSSSALIDHGEQPQDVRQQIASPGGMTAEGLHVMQKNGLNAMMEEAIKAATDRSKELAMGAS